DDRVFLQVVTLARDVGDHFKSVGQPDLRHFAQRGVRLLGRRGVHPRADAPPKRVRLEGGRFVFSHRRLAPVANQLVDRRHAVVSRTYANVSPATGFWDRPGTYPGDAD